MNALHVCLVRRNFASLAVVLATFSGCSGPEVVADKPPETMPESEPVQPPVPAPDPTLAQPAAATPTVETPAVAAPPAEPTPVAADAKPAEPQADQHPADVRYPSSPAESLINDGVNLTKDNNLFDARQRLQAATQQDPKSATAWYNLALVQQRTGNPDEAILSAKKAVELNPTYSRAVVLLAVLHLRKGESRQALDAVEQGLQRRPGDVMLLGVKARVLVEEKDYQRALDTAITAIKLDQDNPESLRYLAEAYLGLGREGLARLALDRAFQIYTGTQEASGAAGEAASAKKAYELRMSRGGGTWRGVGSESIDRDAGVAHIYYLYGQMALKKNDVVEAREHFLQATKLRPSYGEAWNNLGVCWIAAKKGEEAIEALTRALEIQPTSFEARLNLGSAYRISKDPARAEKAKAEYERAQKQDPRSAAPVFNLGILYLETQLPDVATGEARFQKALEYFSQYRELRGSASPGKDPLDDYVAEAKNLLKIEQDKRKVQEKAAAEKTEDEKKKIEDQKKKAEEDARKAAEAAAKAEEEAKKAQQVPPPETPPPDAKPPETTTPPETKPPEAKPPETAPTPPPAGETPEKRTEKPDETPPPPPPPPPPAGDKPAEDAPPPPPPPPPGR